MKTIRQIAFRIVLGLGWASLLACTALVAVEQSGLAEGWLRGALDAQLLRLGATIEIERVDFDWLEPGVELRGVTISSTRELMHAERMHLSLGLTDARRPYLAGVEIERGRLLVGDSLSELTVALDEDQADAPDPAAGAGFPVPAVQIRGLQVLLELDAGRSMPLATVDLSIDPSANGDSERPLASGRLTLPLAEGAPEAARVHFVGRRTDERWIVWNASAQALSIASVRIPTGPGFEGIRDLAPRGEFDVDFHGRLDLDDPLSMSGGLRLRARELAVVVTPGSAPVEEGTLDLEARLHGSPDTPPWLPSAWTAGARISASWSGHGFHGGARIGGSARPGDLVEVWVRIPELEMNPELVALFRRAKFIRNPYEALKPEGEFDLTLGAKLLEGWRAPQSIVPYLELTVAMQAAGPLNTKWRGIPQQPGDPRIAFPMPCRTRKLALCFARTARIPRPEYLGVLFAGDHASGEVEVEYYAWSPLVDLPPFTPRANKAEAEIHIHSSSIAVNEELHTALGGLSDLPGVRDVWDTYQPSAGAIGIDIRLAERTRLEGPAGFVNMELRECSATWTGLPVPVHRIEGTVQYSSDGLGNHVVAFALEGQTDSAPRVALHGRLREEAGRPAEESAAAEGLVLEVDAIDLGGTERKIIATSLPAIGAALDAFGPSGRADLRFRRARARRGGRATTRFELRPLEGVSLTPEAFPVTTLDVRGRVVSEATEAAGRPGRDEAPGEESETTTRIVPLLGDWPGGTLVSLTGTFNGNSPGSVEVAGSGLRPSDGALIDALSDALPTNWADSTTDGLDPRRIGGALDFQSRWRGLGDEATPESEHRILLRRNDLTLGNEALVRNIDGELLLKRDQLTSPEIAAVLGSTRLELEETRVEIGAEGLTLATKISARGFRLDREHLAPFLDGSTLESLLDSFGLRGEVDVDGWELAFERDSKGSNRLELAGDFTLTNVFVDMGVPLAIGSAVGRIDELVVEDGHTRWRATLNDMYGRLFGRELGPVRMLASAYDSHLTLQTLEGSFARGTLRGLDRDPAGGAPRDRPAPTLSVDLAPPYPFELALDLEDADVAVILGDLFPDGVASRGRLSSRLRLRGELDDLLSIRGDGALEVAESRLWSIPVFRDLFSKLGLEANVTFEEMSTQFKVEDASVRMSDIVVSSPILNLVGDGTLDLDGTLHFDLSVTYSAIDKVRLVREIVYLVQNSLLSVSIRGDMSSPVVILRGSLSRLFNPVRDEYRRLPLPAYSRLPERF